MKTLFSLIALLLLLLSLTACGGAERQRLSNNEAQAAPAQAEEAAASTSAGDPAEGRKLFEGTCSACHGPEGKGVPGLGKDMTTSEFIADKSDAELIEFIKMGRDPSHPLNTTGVAMPPKGGNPTLDEAKLQDIVAFIRTIHQTP